MKIIVCPGQGSQTPGFLKDWLQIEGAKEFLEELSVAAEVDLIQHGTTSDADTIRDTAIAQPLIVAASLLTWHLLKNDLDVSTVGVSGHSVGEFAAASIAGVISPTEALRLVGVRGRAMATAASKAETSMSAVVGGIEKDVVKAITENNLIAANRNGGGQIVAAGLKDDLTRLQEHSPRGARVIPLQVAGAFHTEYMVSAVPILQEEADNLNPSDPQIPIWTNEDGRRVNSGKEFINLLVSQIAQPVRWDLCMESFQDVGLEGLVELTPGGALTGLAKRALRGTPTVAFKTPNDKQTAIEILNT